MEIVRTEANTNRISQADEIMLEAESVWRSEELPQISAADRQTVRDCAFAAAGSLPFAGDFADACEYFYLFRTIHRFAESKPAWAVLTGDYFFSRFSHALIPIDNVELIDRFSDYLKKDTREKGGQFDLDLYLAFIRQTAGEILR